MWRFLTFLFAGLMLVSCGDPAEEASITIVADKIFTGGTIYTGDPEQPVVQAVAIAGNRIIVAGTEAEAGKFLADGTEIIDLGGTFMFPGFTDAHAHILGIGQREMVLNLETASSLADVVSMIANAAEGASEGEQILGVGWIETHWPEARVPNRHDLDAVAPNQLVFIRRADGHSGVVNTRTLEFLGIDKNTPDPVSGQILREADGMPSGMLIDAAADNANLRFLEALNDNRQEAYAVGSRVLASYGWTQIHNMWHDYDDVGLMERLGDDGRIQVRVYNSIGAYSSTTGVSEAALDLLTSGPRQNDKGNITTRAIKLYMDGALGSRGALLLEPYNDVEGVGLLLANKDDYISMMKQALADGIQVNTHAIGDAGNRMLLDWYEEAFAAVPVEEWAVAEPRWRDEHTQILHPADIPRFAELGVIPSMQPSHAIGDLYFAPDRLGADRLVGAYAWRSLIDSGAIIAGGSDAPVERGDPRIEFYAAVTRKSLDGFSNEDWHAEQAVTREEALKMLTIWPAYASFQENDLGTIEVGKLADFTVFSADIMTIPEEEILSVDVVMTVVDGRVVYKYKAFFILRDDTYHPCSFDGSGCELNKISPSEDQDEDADPQS